MKNFIDFLGDVRTNVKLASEFTANLNSTDITPQQFANWFQTNKYDVSEEDCEKLRKQNVVHGPGRPVPAY